jgi:NADPH:quinone reductase
MGVKTELASKERRKKLTIIVTVVLNYGQCIASRVPSLETLAYLLAALAVPAIVAYLYLSFRGKSRGRVPSTMRALMLQKHVPGQTTERADYDGCFSVDAIETPKPRTGQVLVKIERSPINPSDLSNLKGSYNSAQRAALPCTVGFEASGTVVQSGGGLVAGLRYGKRVGCVSKGSGAMWAEYAVVPATQTIELPDDVSFTDGCSCFVNPMTAIAFLEIAEAGGHRAILHTAAGSALGKMVLRLAARKGVAVVAVVRSEGHVAPLTALGAAHVIVTARDNWQDELKQACEKTQCRLGFDAVAGPQLGLILKAMPNRSTIRVYGGLSNQAGGALRPTELIFRDSCVRGFWLTGYMRSKNILGLLKWTRTVQQLIATDLATDFLPADYSLDQLVGALIDYNANMSAGKAVLSPPIQ